MFGAGVIQGITGFGSALFGMPLLTGMLGARLASPLFAASILLGEVVGLVRFRHALTFSAVWRLTVGALVGIPWGVYGVTSLDEAFVTRTLGIIVIGYALYRLLIPRLPRLVNPRWAYPFGFAAGLLTGAYNTGGPGYVIYGTTQGWPPDTFRANLQGVFMVGTVTALLFHGLKGNITPEMLGMWPYAGASLVGGLFAGYGLAGKVSPAFFTRLVLITLLIIGLNLLF